MIDWTINVLQVVEIGSIVLGGLGVMFTLRNDVKTMKKEISGVQTEIKKLGDILISQETIRGEIRVLDARLNMAEQDIREMKHGDGYVKGPRGIDREYK
jgi:hypothetical protein